MSTAIAPRATLELSRLTAKRCREQHSTDLNGPFQSQGHSDGEKQTCQFAQDSSPLHRCSSH
jgi:hypothetical protein